MHPKRIPIAKPSLGAREAEAAARAVLSGWVTQGPEVSAFEEEFAEAVGAPFACAVSSCTTALHLALLVGGIGPGDEVIVPSHSFIASANAIRYVGATPVFVDIDPASFNITAPLVREAIGPRTRALMIVHQAGMPADLGAILEVARRNSLLVIEDAACAIGSEILTADGWQRIGRPHGDIACFSFHPRKVLTTGDGGMICTARADWDVEFRRLRQHGMSVSDTVRHAAAAVIQESYLGCGYNYRMTDIQAAVGRVQLSRLDSLVTNRRRLAATYQSQLSNVVGITLPDEPPWARTNWQSFIVRLDEGISQIEVMNSLLASGISTRRGIMCSHREPAFPRQSWLCGHRDACQAASSACHHLIESERAQDQCLILPLYEGLAQDEIKGICARLVESISQYSELGAKRDT